MKLNSKSSLKLYYSIPHRCQNSASRMRRTFGICASSFHMHNGLEDLIIVQILYCDAREYLFFQNDQDNQFETHYPTDSLCPSGLRHWMSP